MSDQMNRGPKRDVEAVLEGMRAESERGIATSSSYAAKIAWYWCHIGAIDLAFQLGLIDNERRQELYDGFKPLKPAAPDMSKPSDDRQDQDLSGPAGPIMS